MEIAWFFVSQYWMETIMVPLTLLAVCENYFAHVYFQNQIPKDKQNKYKRKSKLEITVFNRYQKLAN